MTAGTEFWPFLTTSVNGGLQSILLKNSKMHPLQFLAELIRDRQFTL